MRARRIAVATLLVVSLGHTSAADDAEPRRPRAIEEIVVTAQKREEAAIDVPLSMSVIDETLIADQALTDIRDVMTFVPNASIQDPGGVAIQPVMRGMKVGFENPAFEQPVGLVVDGIPYGRVAYFTASLLDVERVEVLRGPQGTTFGKNTTAGLISIITKDPTDDYTGSVDLQVGEPGRRRAEGAVGGPLLRNVVNFRFAALSDERDGFIRNTTAELSPVAFREGGGRERKSFRAKLGFPNLLGSRLVLAYDWLDLYGTSMPEIWHLSPIAQSFIRTFDPNADFTRKNYVASMDQPFFRKTRIDTFTTHWTDDFRDWALDVVGGYSNMRSLTFSDVDASPVPLGTAEASEPNATTATVEIRGTAPLLRGLFGLERVLGHDLGSTDFLGGFFFQRRTLEVFTGADVNPIPAIAVLGLEEFGLPALPLPSLTEADVTAGTERSEMSFAQDGSTFAGFIQPQWHFLPRWTLQLGARLSYETKHADWQSLHTSPTNIVLIAGGIEDFEAKESRSEVQFQPKVSLNWKPLDGLSLFARWSKGFKGGGFNAFAFTGNERELSYGPESVTEWAFDVKSELFDGLARANLSFFWMELRDFQVITSEFGNGLPPFDTLGTVRIVRNAGAARARGIEGDAAWLPTDWLTLIATLGFNDTEYTDFPFAGCRAYRRNTDGDDDPRCDITGEPFTFAPKWVTTIAARTRFPLIRGIDFVGGITTEYHDTHFVGGYGPEARQESYIKLQLDAGFADLGHGWSARFVVENATDEITEVQQTAIGLPASSISSDPAPPRAVFGQMRWAF